MNIYLVKRQEGSSNGEYDSFVICCNSEHEARNFHPEIGTEYWQDDNFGAWPVKREKLEVTLLGKSADNIEFGILIKRYNK